MIFTKRGVYVERTWNILSYVNLIHNTISNMKSRYVTSSDRKKEETWVRVERKLSQLYIRLRYSNASQCAKQPFQLFSSNWWLLVLINQGLINTYEYQCWSMLFTHILYPLKSFRDPFSNYPFYYSYNQFVSTINYIVWTVSDTLLTCYTYG